MDMKFINSIGNTLIPNFSLMDPELLWKLIHILDFTFSFYSKNTIFTEQAGSYNASYGKDPAANSTISKITLEILFKISEGYQEETSADDGQSEESQKRVNLSKLATKKLILKCRRILAGYVYDDQRSGSMPLPRYYSTITMSNTVSRNRLLEICYILEKLRKLNIPLNSFMGMPVTELENNLQQSQKYNGVVLDEEGEEGPGTATLLELQKGVSDFNEIALIQVNLYEGMDLKVLNRSKGHLIYLMPLFSECITCREPELKDLLKKIFLEVSKELGVIIF